MNRQQEIRELNQLTPTEVRQKAGERLIVCPDLDTLHQRMATDIADIIEHNNRANKVTALILPVGPTGQYPILVSMLHARDISLANCWFFFMDEYCAESGKVVDPTHPLSFQRIANELFLSQVPNKSNLNAEQVIFPTENNIDKIPRIINEIGGIDTCYGGIGIHGHIAFNEPEPNVETLGVRKVRLNDFTVTINAIRSQVGGDLENFPRYAYTLGMKEILSAKQIRLYCRNGINLDWANTILRLALFGKAGDDYPVTFLRNHRNWVLVTDEDTLASPQNVL